MSVFAAVRARRERKVRVVVSIFVVGRGGDIRVGWFERGRGINAVETNE